MWQHWLKYRHFRPELQYLLSSPTVHVCQPFPVVIARASSGAAAGCCLLAPGCRRWGVPPTAGAVPWARPAKIRRSSSSFPLLQQNLDLSLFVFFFQKWLAMCSAVYPASRACSHTKARCCQHKATQRAVLSFPLGLSKEASAHRVPTARLETSHHQAAVGLGSCCCGTRSELVSSPTGHRLSHSSWCFLL